MDGGGPEPYVAHVVEHFGLGRLMWGSDWPVSLLAASYDQVLTVAPDAAGPISEGDRGKLMGRNAIDFNRPPF